VLAPGERLVDLGAAPTTSLRGRSTLVTERPVLARLVAVVPVALRLTEQAAVATAALPAWTTLSVVPGSRGGDTRPAGAPWGGPVPILLLALLASVTDRRRRGLRLPILGA